jgi:ABC-type lipopolysaccharide export system ATPase subunit
VAQSGTVERTALPQKEKKGIIITDHLYRHVLDISNKLYLMKEGKSIYIKDWDDVALHGYVNEFSEHYR